MISNGKFRMGIHIDGEKKEMQAGSGWSGMEIGCIFPLFFRIFEGKKTETPDLGGGIWLAGANGVRKSTEWEAMQPCVNAGFPCVMQRILVEWENVLDKETDEEDGAASIPTHGRHFPVYRNLNLDVCGMFCGFGKSEKGNETKKSPVDRAGTLKTKLSNIEPA